MLLRAFNWPEPGLEANTLISQKAEVGKICNQNSKDRSGWKILRNETCPLGTKWWQLFVCLAGTYRYVASALCYWNIKSMSFCWIYSCHDFPRTTITGVSVRDWMHGSRTLRFLLFPHSMFPALPIVTAILHTRFSFSTPFAYDYLIHFINCYYCKVRISYNYLSEI